jgi:pimeloyl-ACP methyl ester carboxylesterase
MSDWETKRMQLLDSLQAAMGPLPSLQPLHAFDVQYKDSLKTENYTRFTISFRVADDEYLPAYLYIPTPKGPTRKYPAMLALHQTAAEGKDNTDAGKNMTYAKELAHRGYVVIAPDYPGFGDLSDYDFQNNRYQSGTMKGIFDHIRCVDLLQSMPEVDAECIGVIGHSLGGHNAMFVGAFDTRLKVVVTSCGWTAFEYYNIGAGWGGRLGPWAQDKYMPLLHDKYQLDGDKIPFNFHEIIALIAPRRFFSSSPVNDSNFDVEGVKVGIDKAKEAYRFMNVEDRLQVRYPLAEHDFPNEVRLEVYRFIDEIFGHRPVNPDWLVDN